MTPLKQIAIPQCFRSVDEADFYRRGWRDAEAGQAPAELKGYAPALVLAYAAGGMGVTGAIQLQGEHDGRIDACETHCRGGELF